MKKLLLLLASGSIAISGNAQMRTLNFDNRIVSHNSGKTYELPKVARTAAKTTAAPDRVYSYWQYLDTVTHDVAGIQTGTTFVTNWQDGAQLGGFSTGYDTIDMVSVATILHPQAPSLNSATYYTGEMQISPSDAYTVKSVHIYGIYDFDPSHTQVDTLVLSFVYGDANSGPSGNGIFKNGSVTGGHYGYWPVVTTRYDTTSLNYARNDGAWGTPAANVVKVILGPSSFGDTSSTGVWNKEITLPGSGLNVPAGKQVGMSWSFKSGLATLPAMDTIFYSDGSLKYNMWRPAVRFVSNDGTATGVQFAPQDTLDFNQGMYKTLPHDENGWDYVYVPQWAWSSTSGSGASVLQYPVVDWKINCPTCTNITGVSVADAQLISKVNAYPNPAGDVLNVPFTLATATNVSVTLTNVLGQVIATQEMGKVASGTAKFNTTTLPSGVYTYSVLANGQRSTGRVAINH